MALAHNDAGGGPLGMDLYAIQAIQSLSAGFSTAGSLDEVAVALLRHGAEIAGAQVATLALVNEEGALQIALGPPPEGGAKVGWAAAPLDESTPLGSAILRRRPVLLPCREAMVLRYPLVAEVNERAGYSSYAAVPLLSSSDDALGAAGFCWWLPQSFEPDRVRCLEWIGAFSGYVLERVDRARRLH